MRELFLTSLGGMQYGIWKDDVLSVRDLRALHRIPLSPACIAGIIIDDGRSVTLADLRVCMGHEPSPGMVQGTGEGSILLMAEGDKVTGFVVSGEILTIALPPESIFPLPGYLKTPVFDRCAIHDGIPIPIINVAELYSRLLKVDDESLADSVRVFAAEPRDIPEMERIRFFAAGGERYAVSATRIDERSVKPGPVTPIPNTPRYVKGATFWNGRLLPVIDLAQRIKRQSAAPESLMLVAGIADAVFGLLIDGDGGNLPAGEVAIKPAPLIVQTTWLKHVVVHAGEIIPLVDLAMALSPDSGAGEEKPIWQRYAPGSGFPGHFAGQDVDVVEFSLLGVRHALPKEEVQHVIAFKPCREFPYAPPIVIGVAEHDGDILPVVDLAMMFGRRSLATSAWHMLLVSNGDFRALVITEAVFGERRLPLGIHCAVPIQLPHHLMYGCYPDADAVIPILNVEAISVHFEKSLIQQFLPALSHGMKELSTEVEPDHEAALSPAEHEALAVQQLGNVQQQTVEQAHELLQQANKRGVEEGDALESAGTQEPLPAKGGRGEWDTDEAPEQERVPFADAAAENAMEPELAAISEQLPGGEYITAEHNDSVTASAQSASELQWQAEEVDVEFIEVQEKLTGTSVITPAPEQLDAARPAVTSGNTRESRSAANQISANETPERTVVFPAVAASEIAIMPGTMISAASLQAVAIQQLVKDKPEPLTAAAGIRSSAPVYQDERAARARQRRVAYGAIAAALLAVFYLVWSSNNTMGENPGAAKPVKATEPVKTEQAKVQAGPVNTAGELAIEKDRQARLQAAQAEAQALAEHEAKVKADQQAKADQSLVLSQQDKAQAEPPRPAEKFRAPLELDIPKNRPVDIDMYVVEKQDTLWSISQRFTGSPYNYPRLAGENKIANPDLIFPGQRIRLIK